MKKQIYYKRLIWLVFITLYSALFFFNCLSPSRNWLLSYIYTMVLILFLGKEYYQKHLFFQPNTIRVEEQNFLLRALFALFFYSTFVFGIITIVWWHQYRIGLAPVTQVLGIALLIFSAYYREQAYQESDTDIARFYHSVIMLIFSMALGYDSYLVILYAAVIGMPLVFLQLGQNRRAAVRLALKKNKKKPDK